MIWRKREYSAADDVRETPPDFFARLNEKHNFTIDACALPSNAKCQLFYAQDGLYAVSSSDGLATRVRADVDGLMGRYDKQRVFCNPPFSQFDLWLPWAWRHSEAETITMIAPATRTDRPWWQTYVEPYRDDQPERRGSWAMPHIPGVDMRHDWRLRTDYTPDRIDFLEDGHPIYQKDDQGNVKIKKSGKNKGDPFVSTAMFGLVILEWSRV